MTLTDFVTITPPESPRKTPETPEDSVYLPIEETWQLFPSQCQELLEMEEEEALWEALEYCQSCEKLMVNEHHNKCQSRDCFYYVYCDNCFDQQWNSCKTCVFVNSNIVLENFVKDISSARISGNIQMETNNEPNCVNCMNSLELSFQCLNCADHFCSDHFNKDWQYCSECFLRLGNLNLVTLEQIFTESKSLDPFYLHDHQEQMECC